MPGPHYVGDVLGFMHSRPWDIIIAHPPCTYLANSGVRWLYEKGTTIPVAERWDAMRDGAAFFAEMLAAPAKYVAVENPVMHKHGRAAVYEAYTDITDGYDAREDFRVSYVQPWEHGDGETKRTGLWLRNLPPLVPTNIVAERKPAVWLAGPSPDRWKDRSRTYPGIAEAMAEQWGSWVLRQRNINL